MINIYFKFLSFDIVKSILKRGVSYGKSHA
jgi:hypothetical protein